MPREQLTFGVGISEPPDERCGSSPLVFLTIFLTFDGVPSHFCIMIDYNPKRFWASTSLYSPIDHPPGTLDMQVVKLWVT